MLAVGKKPLGMEEEDDADFSGKLSYFESFSLLGTPVNWTNGRYLVVFKTSTATNTQVHY